MSPQSIIESFKWLKEQSAEMVGGFLTGIVFTCILLLLFRRWILRLIKADESKKVDELQTKVQQLEVSQRRLEEIEKQINHLPEQLMFALPMSPDCPAFVPLGRGRPHIISIFNLKGGVGKTTLAGNLAYSLSSRPGSPRILLIDADWQGSLTSLCVPDDASYKTLLQAGRLTNKVFNENILPANPFEYLHGPTALPNSWLLGADGTLSDVEEAVLIRWIAKQLTFDPRFALRRLLHSDAIAAAFDFVIIDCPPRLTAASVAALGASDHLVIPVIPDDVSLSAATILLKRLRAHARANVAQHLNVAGIVVNKVKAQGLTLMQQNKMDEYRQIWHREWGVSVRVLDKKGEFIPVFNQSNLSYSFPAADPSLAETFANIASVIVPN